jgi:hypothetical protein
MVLHIRRPSRRINSRLSFSFKYGFKSIGEGSHGGKSLGRGSLYEEGERRGASKTAASSVTCIYIHLIGDGISHSGCVEKVYESIHAQTVRFLGGASTVGA